MLKDEKKNKHMTLDDRMEVQECLEKAITFKGIGRRIGKDPTTVSKEVKLHAQRSTNSFTKADETCPKLLKHRLYAMAATVATERIAFIHTVYTLHALHSKSIRPCWWNREKEFL